MKYLILFTALLFTGCGVTIKNPICLFACKAGDREAQSDFYSRLSKPGDCSVTNCVNGACMKMDCSNADWNGLVKP